MIEAANIWLELRSRSGISVERETTEHCYSERIVVGLDTGDVVVSG